MSRSDTRVWVLSHEHPQGKRYQITVSGTDKEDVHLTSFQKLSETVDNHAYFMKQFPTVESYYYTDEQQTKYSCYMDLTVFNDEEFLTFPKI